MRRYWRPLAATVGGLSLPLAFAPFDAWPVAMASVAALWLAWVDQRPRVAARLGFLWGAGAFLAGTYWLYISLHIFGGAPLLLAIPLMLGLVAIMAVYPALLGYALARWHGRDGPATWFLVLPASFVLVEWLRGWLFTGFPWLSLGYSQIDGPLGGWAPVGGVALVSWNVAVCAGALIGLLRGRAPVRLASVAVLAALHGGGAWLVGHPWTVPLAQPMTVALIQGGVAQDQKWLPSQLGPTMALYVDLTREHADRDLVVWPEAAIPAVRREVQDYLDGVDAEARQAGLAVVLGILQQDPVTRRYHNSVISLGTAEGEYHKRHLVPFGEYFPVPDFVRGWMKVLDLPYTDIAEGEPDQAPIRIDGQRAALTICYEDIFGAEQRVFLPEASFLINVSNDAWFGDSIAPHQHLQMARMRALETGRAMLRATNTGISAIIGADGRIEAVSPQFQPHVLTGTIQPREGATPWVVWGNLLTVVPAAVLLVLGALRGPWRGRSSEPAGDRV